MDDATYLKKLNDLYDSMSKDSYSHYKIEIAVHMRVQLFKLHEKILDVEHAIYMKNHSHSKISKLEKQVEELRQMIIHLPGVGSTYLEAKSDFDSHKDSIT
jgi:NRPS condensation-like uncharacterized protein